MELTQTLDFYSAATGIYSSKHPLVPLPTDLHLDLVSFIFSHHNASAAAALIDAANGVLITHSELRILVATLASNLSDSLGIRKGEVVLLLLPNSVLFPVILLAVLSIGAVASTINPLSTVDEIKRQALSSKPSLVFSSLENAGKAGSLGVRVVAVPESTHFDARDFSLFDSLLRVPYPNNAAVSPKPAIFQDDSAAILYSSGTSGRSKGVVLTHRNLISTVELFVRFEVTQYERKGSDNVYLAALPMFHIYGLSLFGVGLLSVGSTVVVMRRFDVEAAIAAVEKFRVTHFPLVPPILAALIGAAGDVARQGGKLDSLVQVSSGAAPLSNRMIQEFVKSFPRIDFIQGYGMTESAAVGTRGFNTARSQKYSSVGLLAPNMQAKIVDLETLACLPPGVPGELWLHGPAIMKGYLNDEDATLSTIVKGDWLRTGDIAYFDHDGYLYVIDRLKDTIKYKGFQIAPADLEAVLMSHPDVIEAAVTSATDEIAGDLPVAFVVKKSGSMLSSAQLMDFVNKQVAPYKKVRRVSFVDAIPKSPSGKVLRRLLKNSLMDSKL